MGIFTSIFLSNFNSISLIALIQFLFIFISLTPIFSRLIMSFRRKKRKVQAKKYPPGPRKLPLIGNLHQLGNLPHRSLEQLYEKYGPVMFLQLGSIPTLVISSADSAKEIFKTHDVVFSGRPVLYAAKKFSYNCASVSFAPYGEYWREIRKIMILELLSEKRVKTFQAVRDEEVGVLLQLLEMKRLVFFSKSLLVILRLISANSRFLSRITSFVEWLLVRFLEMIHETQGLLGGFCMADFFPWLGWLNKLNGLEMRLEKCFRELNNFYDKVIEEHLDPKRPKAEHEDVVDVLLQVQKDPSQAITINNDQIKGVLTDIFIAGSDTTATALVWIMADLIKNPSVMKRAQEEVREVSEGKGKVLERDLSKLNYLKLVIKEGLRLHPPVPLLVPRETTQSCIIEGCQVPPKTRVFVNAKVIGRDPKYWGDPNEFRPERFLDSSVDFKGQNYFELLPFGAGRRGCPGINFLVVLIELALANLLCRFDWQLPHGVKREDLDMEEAFGLTMHKKIPLCLDATIVDL